MVDNQVTRLQIFSALILLILISSSCSVTKYLEDDQKLVVENIVEIKSDEKVKNKSEIIEDLHSLVLIKPNRRFIGINRALIYYRLQDPGDTTWLDRFWKNRIAEKPALLDTSLVRASKESMKNFLFNEGFFDAAIETRDSLFGKRAIIIYTADPGVRYEIDTVIFTSKDSLIHPFLKDKSRYTLLKRGKYVDNDLFSLEKQRWIQAFQDNGYAEFYPQYFAPLKVDTFGRKANIRFEILPPFDAPHHQLFKFGTTDVYVDHDPLTPQVSVRDTMIGDVRFISSTGYYPIRPEILARKIFVEKDEVYRRSAVDRSYNALSAMDNFRTINIRRQNIEIDSGYLSQSIFLTPSGKLIFDGGANINYATSEELGQLIGVSGDVSTLYRNLFGGGENLHLSVESGVELNLNNLSVPTSLNLNIQSQLRIPKFIDLFKSVKWMNKIKLFGRGIVSDRFYQRLKEQGNSRLSLGYNFVSFENLYSYNNFNASLNYDFQEQNRRRYSITSTGIDYYIPDVKDGFLETIGEDTFLLRTFTGRRLFTGVLLKDFSFFRRSLSHKGFSNSIYFNFEQSGAEISIINRLSNWVTGETEDWSLDGIEFSRFVRAEVDHRRYWQINDRHQLAWRGFAGMAFPFGGKKVVPFIRQFNSGGPLSVRAWEIRQLGPGQVKPPDIGDGSSYYQSGDIKLETNLEYRFDLFWVLEGALFVDAGNVWSLASGADIEGKISSNFLDQIAVGSGFGLRFDFSLFLLRFDVAYKLRYPYELDHGSHWGINSVQDLSPRNWTFHWGLDYPF